CEGLYEACVAYGVPLISGKDSMKNDSTRGGVKISIPPTRLVSAMGKIDDVRTALTPEPKDVEDWLYIVGETRQELGASEFARWAQPSSNNAAVGGSPPLTDPGRNIERYRKLAAAIADGIPESVKAPSMGGLGVALAWMAFGAELGIEANLDLLPVEGEVDQWGRLFSESTGRFLVTVSPQKADAFEKAMEGEPLARLGPITDSGRLVITERSNQIIDTDVMKLKEAWKSTLADF
ncbi:MAG: phosphoribosylformylglycinamidine synthase, partial [Candidatus Krumholzibacteria bacterium]|nr:phosphoribosylformylglycinamidine synthase [Candidatus Krumholzibacteria bacterium]